MKLTPASQAEIGKALQTVISLYAGEEDLSVSTDFYFQPQREEGTLTIFNDEEQAIAVASIPEWTEAEEATFYDEVGDCLKEAIEKANGDGSLERLAVWMPYSFVLVDDERETICDLLLVDDDTLVVTDSLLKGLNEELNSFLEQLLKEE